jgi:hypothetical protein
MTEPAKYRHLHLKSHSECDHHLDWMPPAFTQMLKVTEGQCVATLASTATRALDMAAFKNSTQCMHVVTMTEVYLYIERAHNMAWKGGNHPFLWMGSIVHVDSAFQTKGTLSYTTMKTSRRGKKTMSPAVCKWSIFVPKKHHMLWI